MTVPRVLLAVTVIALLCMTFATFRSAPIRTYEALTLQQMNQ